MHSKFLVSYQFRGPLGNGFGDATVVFPEQRRLTSATASDIRDYAARGIDEQYARQTGRSDAAHVVVIMNIIPLEDEPDARQED